jgi:hypothetical protein
LIAAWSRRSSIGRVKFWLVCATVLVATVAARLIAHPRTDPFSPEPVEVRFGGEVYAIPRNYLVYVSKDIHGETANAVLRALWPGLEPLSPDNARLWDRRRPKQQIHFGLMRQPRDGYSQIQGLAQLRGVHSQKADFGLTRFRWHLVEYYAGNDPTARRPDGLPIALRCHDFPDSTKASFEVERNCIVEYPLVDGVGLHYRFFMVNMDQWRAIDQAVRALVDGFRCQAPASGDH